MRTDNLIDPVTLAVFQGRLDYISQQMGWVMLRTARSPIFTQSHDFSCFIADPRGEIIAQADGIPIHSAGGGPAMQALLRDYGGDLRPGDVFLLNDPYLAGGNHLPDWLIARPAFADDALIGFACNRAHQSDIGGGAAGTYNPQATEIFHEGIRLPVLRLVERDRIREDLWRLLMANSRTPEQLDGDLRAMLGSAKIGAIALDALVSEFGIDATLLTFEHLLFHAETRQRQAFQTLTPGTYTGEDRSDNDCFKTVDVWVRVSLTVSADGSAVVDFAGSDAQILGFKNSSQANTISAVMVAVAAFFEESIPRNAGRLRCIKILAPEGSIVNAVPPAPMTMCTVFCAQEIIHAIWKALAKADPERGCAGWAKNIFGVSAGTSDRGPFVLYHAAAAAGSGAVNGRDGFNSIGHLSTLGGFTLPNIETHETQYPVRYHRQEFRIDGAGPGRFRGGSGVHYDVEVLSSASHSFRGEGLRYVSSYGLGGGYGGSAGEMQLEHRDGSTVPAPQFGIQNTGPLRIVAASPGGGGFGSPLERDTAAVFRDYRDEIVSEAVMNSVYGVELNATGSEVDHAATLKRRAKLSAAAANSSMKIAGRVDLQSHSN